MKRLVLLSVILTIVGLKATADDKNALHVKTQVEGFVDSIAVKVGDELMTFTSAGGQFDFMLPLSEASYITLATPATFRGEEMKYINIPAVQGETVELTGSLYNRWNISGSRFYQDLSMILSEIEQAALPFNQFKKNINDQAAAGGNQDSLRQVFLDHEAEMQQQEDEALLDIIRRHADKEAVTVVAGQFGDRVSKIQQALKLMSREVREGRVHALANTPLEAAKMKQASEEESAKKQASGVVAHDFTLTDINGNPLSLSSLRGKYVLLDFWGSWCTWCKEGFPKMRKQYKKYADRFEIVGIACRDTEKDWRKTVKDYRLSWKHVICPSDSDVLEQYGILGFPTKILIDPEGKIVKAFTGEDPLYYSFIDAQFGE